MADLKLVLTDVAKAIVDHPDEVVVTESVVDDTIVLELHAAPEDIGKVIGRHGRIARAIRALVKAAANLDDKKVSVEIK